MFLFKNNIPYVGIYRYILYLWHNTLRYPNSNHNWSSVPFHFTFEIYTSHLMWYYDKIKYILCINLSVNCTYIKFYIDNLKISNPSFSTVMYRCVLYCRVGNVEREQFNINKTCIICNINECFLFIPYSGKPEMPKERDVGEAAETTRRSSGDHQIHGTTGVGAPHRGKYKRPISSSSDSTKPVAFDQRIRISSEKRRLLRVAQPDSCFVGRRWWWWRSYPRISECLQKFICSTSHQIYSDAASQYQ